MRKIKIKRIYDGSRSAKEVLTETIAYKVKRKIESEEEVLCLERNTGKNDHFIEKSKIDLEQKNE